LGKDHDFSKDLQSTSPGDYHFDGLQLKGYRCKIPHSFPLTKKHIFTLHGAIATFVANEPNIVCGGFKYVFFSNPPLKMIQFDEHIFQMGGSTTKN